MSNRIFFCAEFESKNAALTQKEIQAFQRMGFMPEPDAKAKMVEDNARDKSGCVALSQLLQLRAFAFCMFGIGSLAAWRKYCKKFEHLFSSPAGVGCRSPSVEEAQDADATVLQAAFDEVNKTCFLTNKLSDLSKTVDEQLALIIRKGGELDWMLRPRPAYDEAARGWKRPWPEADDEEPGPDAKKGKGKGKGKGKNKGSVCRFFKQYGHCKFGDRCFQRHEY